MDSTFKELEGEMNILLKDQLIAIAKKVKSTVLNEKTNELFDEFMIVLEEMLKTDGLFNEKAYFQLLRDDEDEKINSQLVSQLTSEEVDAIKAVATAKVAKGK